jgi:uncharacterized protein (TIGR02421 family)
MSPQSRLTRLQEIDRALSKASRGIRVLRHLAWPAEAQQEFLSSWRAGRPELPRIELVPPSYTEEIAALRELAERCDRADPLGALLRRSALSYVTAARMLEGIGTPQFTACSTALYGGPDTPWESQTFTGVDAAEHLLAVTDRLLGNFAMPPTVYDIPAEVFAERLRAAIDPFFTDDEVEVVLDDDLSSKAIASSKRIRVRKSALFSELDLDQLVHHEAFIHSGTKLNGMRQPHLQVLGLGTPRTTRTQEGLAVLAELMTLAIGIRRLRRVAVRVKAAKRAIDGGDFIDVFSCFLDSGQTEDESFQSAQRIFRGGDVRGGVAFTKDSAYLRGLLEVHTFFRAAIRDNRPELAERIFAGRLTLADVVLLDEAFGDGTLVGPRYVPAWAKDLRRVAAAAAFSGFVAEIELENVQLSHFAAVEERLEASADI